VQRLAGDVDEAVAADRAAEAEPVVRGAGLPSAVSLRSFAAEASAHRLAV
jgi:hypothetical protein